MSKLMIIPEKPCYIAGAAALPLSAMSKVLNAAQDLLRELEELTINR